MDVVKSSNEEKQNCQVVQFKYGDDVKLTKAGNPKKTYSSSKKGVKKEVYPFKTQKDLQNMINFFKDNSLWEHFLLFTLGTNMGRRIGDTISLKWEHFYFDNGRMRSKLKEIEEQKTDKLSDPTINSACRKAIDIFIHETGIEPSNNEYQDFVFKGLKKGTHMSPETYRLALKKAAEACKIDYNIASHSTRKTFGYWSRLLHPNDPNSMSVLMSTFQHSSEKITSAYIGLTREIIDKYYNDMGDFFSNYVMENKEYTLTNKASSLVTVSFDDLKDIVELIYKAGIDNANIQDYTKHLETINSTMDMIVELSI